MEWVVHVQKRFLVCGEMMASMLMMKVLIILNWDEEKTMQKERKEGREIDTRQIFFDQSVTVQQLQVGLHHPKIVLNSILPGLNN